MSERPSSETAIASAVPAVDAFRARMEAVLERQAEHAVYLPIGIDWGEPYDITEVTAVVGAQRQRRSAEWVVEAVARREEIIRKERLDPYRFGFEPEIWHETDWRIAELRCAKPGEPIACCVLGGNGSSKTWYAAKRFAICMVENEDWLCWQFAEEEKTSREVPQQFTQKMLPLEFRPESGKLKKGAAVKLNYNAINGFTDNTFALPNRCRANFMFYKSDIKALEGPRPDFVWADELIPVQWVEAAKRRLITKAGETRKLVPALREALKHRHEPGAWEKWLKPLLPRLFQGVLLMTFTPKEGYTPTVALMTEYATTLVEVPAEILPIEKNGERLGYEKVPRVRLNLPESAVIIYFHVYDNPFGGNWEAMKATLARKGRDDKLWMAYGVATKQRGVQFPLFCREAHVRPLELLPAEGTWYHIVDPCTDGRNWFMLWAKVCPNPVGKPLIFVAREWPQPGDWIEANDVGDPGEWAVMGSGKKLDGERGPAQRNWGLGFQQYAQEIERVEKELWRLEQRLAGKGTEGAAAGAPLSAREGACAPQAEGRIQIFDGCRIMDSRSANTETQLHGESLTLIQVMQEYGLYFCSAGRDSGAEQGSTTVREGAAMITDRINFERDKTELVNGIYKFHGRAPSILIAESCANLIFCLGNWTGADGRQGAMKDPVDVLRYLVIANPQHFTAEMLQCVGGGCY